VRHLEARHLAVVRPCPETRRGIDEAAVEETMPVSCETDFSETILPEKDSLVVREGSIEDGAAKRCRVWSQNFDARCTRHARVMRAGFVRRA
jgi:hypothetical protein